MIRLSFLTQTEWITLILTSTVALATEDTKKFVTLMLWILSMLEGPWFHLYSCFGLKFRHEKYNFVDINGVCAVLRRWWSTTSFS